MGNPIASPFLIQQTIKSPALSWQKKQEGYFGKSMAGTGRTSQRVHNPFPYDAVPDHVWICE
jgi:hypothetical protein